MYVDTYQINNKNKHMKKQNPTKKLKDIWNVNQFIPIHYVH